MFYAKSTGGFYDTAIHGNNIPADAVEITEKEHARLLLAQATDKVIDFSGQHPVAISPTTLKSIDDLKTDQKKFINSVRDSKLKEGFTFDGDWFDCDEVAISRVIGTVSAITAGIPLPNDFTWRTKYNSNKPMTPEQMIALGASMLQFVQETMKRSWQLKDLIDSRRSKDQVESIGWDTPLETL